MDVSKVGIISHTLVQQHHLRQIVEECGLSVHVVWLIDPLLADIKQLDQSRLKEIDIWLVDVDVESVHQRQSAQVFERWLFALNQPVIFGEGATYSAAEQAFQSWSRQLKAKLLSAFCQLSGARQQPNIPRAVWVLAASTGGPDVVKRFIDALPAGLGVAFIYAQHIESGQNRTLVNNIVRDSAYSGCMAGQGLFLSADTITMVPSHQQFVLLPDGSLWLDDKPWRGEYRPSIDQVVAMVADCFGSSSGAIFFSGMGCDGVDGARLMIRRGGQIWVQTPESCTSDSMPKAINGLGCVSQMGAPEELARHFSQRYEPQAVL